MGLKYGLNFTASDIAPFLEQNDILQNNVRSWRQLFGNASIGYESQKGLLQNDYTTAIADAYNAHLLQREGIYRAGLSASDTGAMLRTHDRNLADAYDTYLQKYREGLGALGTAYATEIGDIQKGLTDRAQNFADLYSSAYKYWTDELSKSSMLVDDTTKPIYEGEGKKAVATGEYEKTPLSLATEYGFGDLFDAQGQILPWEEASHLFINNEGVLTDRGRQFFDQTFNIKPEGYSWIDDKGDTHTTRGFTQWLSDTNSDLYTWAMSPDGYDYTRAGTNLGTAKSIVGLESDDTAYRNHEYADWSNLSTYDKDFDAAEKNVIAAFDAIDPKMDPSVTPAIDYITDRFKRPKRVKTAQAELAQYINLATQQHNDLLSFAKQSLGSQEFADFQKTNASLVNEYDSIRKDLIALQAEENPTSEKIKSVLSRYNAWQKNYYAKLKELSERPKKASGN